MTGSDDDDDEFGPGETTQAIVLGDLLAQGVPEARRVTATMTCIAGKAAGKMYKIAQDEMILGRAADAHIVVEDDGVSRKHAKIVEHDGTHSVVDLESRNGTLHNGARISEPTPLRDGDRIRLGGVAVFKFGYQDELEEQMQAQLYDSATRDPLTQAFNRRYFDERLATEWAFAHRHRSPCATLAIDADHFKRVNDTYGHAAGDYVLKELVTVIHRVVRKEDLVARVGGEEFLVLARGTARVQAVVLGERIRAAVEAQPFEVNGVRLPVTISVGVATSEDLGVESPAELLSRADEFLYRAKEAGRNRVEPHPR